MGGCGVRARGQAPVPPLPRAPPHLREPPLPRKPPLPPSITATPARAPPPAGTPPGSAPRRAGAGPAAPPPPRSPPVRRHDQWSYSRPLTRVAGTTSPATAPVRSGGGDAGRVEGLRTPCHSASAATTPTEPSRGERRVRRRRPPRQGGPGRGTQPVPRPRAGSGPPAPDVEAGEEPVGEGGRRPRDPGNPWSAARRRRPACPGGSDVPPRAGRPGRGALGQVAEDGERAEADPAGDGPALHRRQVLGLVDDDMAVSLGGCSTRPATSSRRTRSAADQRADLDERGGRGPAGPAARRGRGGRPRPAANACGSLRSRASTSSGRAFGHTASTHALTGRPARSAASRRRRGPAAAFRLLLDPAHDRGVRTRSRPVSYGGSSARTPATIPRSSRPATASGGPSGTRRSSARSAATRAYSARRSTSAIRGSCLTTAVRSSSVPVARWARRSRPGASTAVRRSRRGRGAPPRCRRGRCGWGRGSAGRRAGCGAGGCRGGRRPGAGPRRSCRCPGRPARTPRRVRPEQDVLYGLDRRLGLCAGRPGHRQDGRRPAPGRLPPLHPSAARPARRPADPRSQPHLPVVHRGGPARPRGDRRAPVDDRRGDRRPSGDRGGRRTGRGRQARRPDGARCCAGRCTREQRRPPSRGPRRAGRHVPLAYPRAGSWRAIVEGVRPRNRRTPSAGSGSDAGRAVCYGQAERRAGRRPNAWARRIERARPVGAYVDAVWPRVRPEEVLAELLADAGALGRAAEGC